jgi:hypothetical protein
MPIPLPLVFSPSQLWDGQDGNWSSFTVRVGTPEQNFRVLPSPATGAVIVPHVTGCQPSNGDPYNCAALRGVFESNQQLGFQPNISETWRELGPFQTRLESKLGYKADGWYGLDNVGLMIQNSGGPTLANQVVGGIKKEPFSIGFFGLSPKPTNFTNFNDPQRSYLTTLRDEYQIPSVSYGYSAGAYYSKLLLPMLESGLTIPESPKAFGSLILGGFDESRFEPNNITFPFDKDDERPASLKIQQITAKNTLNGSVSILQDEIYVNLDFTMPYLWLPQDTCDRIASYFELKHDAETGLYLVEDDAHDELVVRNPILTFEFGDSFNLAKRVNIAIPYAAFYLQASWPMYNSTKNYFPIKRANESQYTLGRAFMQEAYVIVDYERGNFSIHQATFPISNEQRIIPIPAKDVEVNERKHGLSKASIAGIATGSTLFFAVIIIFAILLYYRRKQSHIAGQPEAEDWSISKDAQNTAELSENKIIRSQLMSTEVLELQVSTKQEIGGNQRSELE